MAEFIDRKELREAFDNADADVVEEYEDGTCDWGFGRQNILEVINSVPTADVVQVRHGKWLSVEEYAKKIGAISKDPDGWVFCSECGQQSRRFYGYGYCPNCGARMDGDTNA